MKPLIDYSALDCWRRCREEFRQRYVENRAPVKKSLDMLFGGAIHEGIEAFWKGDFENVYKRAWARWKEFDRESITNPKDMEKFKRLSDSLNECLEIYLDKHQKSWENQDSVEEEFVIESLGICGKIDRFHQGILYDVKTATDMGGDWLKSKRVEQLLSGQYSFYDLALREIGKEVKHIAIEVIVKPNERYKRDAKIEIIELDELLAPSIRERFVNQLEWNLAEIRHYIENYRNVKPWPMASSQICVGKYSMCDFATLCLSGETQQNMKLYTIREEHLECRK